MTDHAVHLDLPARPENISLVRHALAGFGEALGMDEEGVAGLKTVVTEATTNAVLHAYDADAGEPGPLEVRAGRRDNSVEVVVRDYGHGFRPRVRRQPAPDAPENLRLGLALIAALCREFELRAAAGGGTEVMMLVGLETDVADADLDDQAPAATSTGETVVTVADDALATVIVSRVISALAARAELSVDRLSDVLLLSDAISSGGSGEFAEGRTRVAAEESDGAISLRVGPLHDGAAERMLNGLSIPSLDASLKSLADEARVERDADGEHLLLRFSRGGGSAAS